MDPLIEALWDRNTLSQVSEKAAVALGQIGAARAAWSLVEALKYENPQAADALARIGAPAVEPLIGALRDDRWQTRQAAAGLLVRLYRSDVLDAAHKHLILVQRDHITAHHADAIDHSSFTNGPSDIGCSHEDTIEHTDSGIGVAFPL